MIVLDTNVVSEAMSKHPSPRVLAVLDSLTEPPGITVITVAEIRFGIAMLPNGVRRQRLSVAAARVFDSLGPLVLPFDLPAADVYAETASNRRSAGRPIAQFDAVIASICRVKKATLLTRNVKDFVGTGISLVDPWTDFL